MERVGVDSTIAKALDLIHAIALEHPLPIVRLRDEVISILEYLSSVEGRTDANCRAVDSAIMLDDDLSDRIDEIEEADPVLAEVLADMGGALHDTVSSPEIADNFNSTPEQLLNRLRVKGSSPGHGAA